MGFHDRAVDQIQAVARFRCQRVENPFPDAASRPAVEAIVRRCIRPIAFRQIAPRHPGAQHVKYRVHNLAIVSACAPSSFRHQWLQKSPFVIAQIKSHDPPLTTVNHDRLDFSRNYVGTDPNAAAAMLDRVAHFDGKIPAREQPHAIILRCFVVAPQHDNLRSWGARDICMFSHLDQPQRRRLR
jgi:hypothetical protein